MALRTLFRLSRRWPEWRSRWSGSWWLISRTMSEEEAELRLLVSMAIAGAPLSLYHLLDPEVLAAPYPLYRRLRIEDPVALGPYLHAVGGDPLRGRRDVFQRFLQNARFPGEAGLAGMERLAPIASVMVRQMLFLDPPEHTRVRRLAAAAFTPRRVETDALAHLRDR